MCLKGILAAVLDVKTFRLFFLYVFSDSSEPAVLRHPATGPRGHREGESAPILLNFNFASLSLWAASPLAAGWMFCPWAPRWSFLAEKCSKKSTY